MANKPFPLAYADPAGLVALPSPATTQSVLVVDGADIKIAASNTLTAAPSGGGGGATAPTAPVTIAASATLAAMHNGSTYANTTSGAITATLPAATSVAAGTRHTVKWIGGGNALTIAVAGASGTIDGAASLNPPSLQASYTFEADIVSGNNWRVI